MVAVHYLLQSAFVELDGAFHKTIGLWIESIGCDMLEILILSKYNEFICFEFRSNVSDVCGMPNFSHMLIR